MSPRKRRTLALPFLVTVAASASCTLKPTNSGEATNNTANTQEPATDQTVIANPPPPGDNANTNGRNIGPMKRVDTSSTTTEEGSTPKKAPIMIVNPPPPGKALPAAPTEGGRLDARTDNTCWWIAKADCPKDKNIVCNPPPPRQVQCPAK